MDKETVKLLLASYLPQDAEDPIFAEALREVAGDPALAAWFEESQRFDAVMTAKFRDLAVPHDVKGHILLGAGASSRWSRHWVQSLGALAALLILGLICWRFLAPRRAGDALALQAIHFTEEMPPLQFVCFDAGAVANWINKQPGARQMKLALPKPPASLSMAMIGSSVVNWNGRPVVMIALQNGKRMAMLYILSDADAAALQGGSSGTIERGDWVVRSSHSDGQVRLLTTKGNREDLDFPAPF